MAQALRVFFLGFYAASIAVMILRVLPAAWRTAPAARQVEGLARYLPVLLVPLGFLVPPGAILLRLGEIRADWPLVRLAGLALGLYAAAILPWSAATLGRFLVPQARVSTDHVLVVEGPYRLVRHPAYSGDLALWLGSALGTQNGFLLALFPLYALGAARQARLEDSLLEARFGDAYRRYAARVGRFVPTLKGLT